jgi:phosphate transport system substrate-binding protein
MVFFVNAFRRIAAASAVAATVAIAPAFDAVAQVSQLNGAGASFPAPLYERYFAEFLDESGIQVNYQAVGSGAGIRNVIAETVDFGGSDAAMTDEQISQVDRGIILVPTAGGAVTVVYNVPGVGNLNLSREVLPAIFTGQITRWNDPQIAADNPGVNLPDLPIRPVVRADSSGTTFIFTNHLSAISPYFRGRVGAATAPRWNINEVRGRGNAGVAAQVGRTRGGIGYVEFAYARRNNLSMAAIENKAGEFVSPSLEATEEALSAIEFPDNFRVFVDDPDSGYPIAGMTWMMIYREYPDAETAEAVKEMVRWVLTEGQEINNTLEYVRIPESVTQRVLQVVESEVGPN